MKSLLPILAALLLAAPAAARPFLTEEVAPLGPWVFETGLAGSYRTDDFGSPKSDYQTVAIPFDAKLGLGRYVDVGFNLLYLSQRLDTGPVHLAGSRSALLNPSIKVSPSRYAGLEFIYHDAVGAEPDQELPVERGDDYELKALFAVPLRFPILLNAGYVWKGVYHSDLGAHHQPEYRIEPGDIVETSAALEVPVRWHFSFIGEGAYYHVAKRRVNSEVVPASAGDAADASVGLNWRSHGWDLGAAVSFGLLKEEYTSFDLERGSGNVTYRFQAHYRLAPRKPESYQ
jgi:hypothetical protein